MTTYRLVLDIEKYVKQSVLQRKWEDFVFLILLNRGVNIWFAVYSIDLLEDMPEEQNKFSSTVIVLQQHAEDGEAVNQPLALPPKAPNSLAQVGFEVKYCKQQVIKAKAVQFETYKLGNKQS